MKITDGNLLRAIVLPVLVLLGAPDAAAQVTVGVLAVPGTTELQFQSGDGEPLVISRYDTARDDGTYVPLCTTPCAVQLPAGSHELMAGDHYTFAVNAAGGVQQWVVEDKSIGGIIGGAVLTGVGPALPLVTLLFRGLFYLITVWGCDGTGDDAQCEFFNDDMNLALIITGAIGGGMLIAGIATLTTSFGGAELTSSTAGTLALGPDLRLAPGLFAYENPSGGPNLGLSLQLRF